MKQEKIRVDASPEVTGHDKTTDPGTAILLSLILLTLSDSNQNVFSLFLLLKHPFLGSNASICRAELVTDSMQSSGWILKHPPEAELDSRQI